MSDTPEQAARLADPRRQQFLVHAAAAYDLLFDPAYQDQLVTFDQREQRADEVGKDLICWLLQQHANADPLAQPDAQRLAPGCPNCGKPGLRHNPPEQPLSTRALVTRNGVVHLKRERFRCLACRIIFFSAGPETPGGD